MDDLSGTIALIQKTIELQNELAPLLLESSPPHKQILSSLPSVDVVITPNEVNERHGTGVLVRRMFPDCSNILSIRSMDTYSGEHCFGAASLRLSYAGLHRPQIFAEVFEALWCVPVRRVLCIPLYPDDVLTAIAIKELFDVPLCTYVMDDQNIYSGHIPDYLMKELLTKSELRLAISPEMRDAYEEKYQIKFWIAPPTVAADLLQTHVNQPKSEKCELKTGILIGNIWSQLWLDLLQKTVRASKFSIDWYGNDKASWLNHDSEQLQQDGIFAHGFLDEVQVVQTLRQYPYAIVPSSPHNHDEYAAIGKLSLPTRIPLIVATSHTPIIVLGNKNSAAAHFVERLGVGISCDYDSNQFREAVEYVCKPENQTAMRQRAASKAVAFTAEGMGDWIWQSLDLEEACHHKFETLFPRRPSDTVHFVEPPVPDDVHADFVPIYQSIRRLKNRGVKLDFVIDVGASVGVWSYVVSKLLPNARYILVDPLISRYDKILRSQFLTSHPEFELVEVAVSNQSGKTTLQISPDLFGSSLLHPADYRTYEAIEVEVTTLDELANKKLVTGRGLLKIDVQCAEHLVLEGASHLLTQTDAVALELSLVRYDERAKVFPEMVQVMDDLGFQYYDDVGCWRSPVDGTLLQKDVLFIRKELLIPETSQKIAPLP